VDSAEHQILTRISFAERWLRRAREECQDGDIGRGLLTLVLADAEVRRLLQLAVPPAPRARPSLRPAVAVAAGLLIAALAALQLGVFALSAPVQSAGLSPGLSLRPGTGALLEPLEAVAPAGEAVQLPAPVVMPPMKPARARGPVPGQAAAPQQTLPPALTPVRAPAVQPVPVAVPAHVSAAAPPAPVPAAPSQAETEGPTLSLADLLDLVIVADRTLRRSQP
jgi:hypothetical protein